MGATGSWNIDTSRHARETLPPATYLASSYYEIWIRAVDVLLERHGFATREELIAEARMARTRATISAGSKVVGKVGC